MMQQIPKFFFLQRSVPCTYLPVPVRIAERVTVIARGSVALTSPISDTCLCPQAAAIAELQLPPLT